MKLTDAMADEFGKQLWLAVKAVMAESEARHEAKILDLQARVKMLETALDQALETAIALIQGEGAAT